jgi:hypothetical protein
MHAYGQNTRRKSKCIIKSRKPTRKYKSVSKSKSKSKSRSKSNSKSKSKSKCTTFTTIKIKSKQKSASRKIERRIVAYSDVEVVQTLQRRFKRFADNMHVSNLTPGNFKLYFPNEKDNYDSLSECFSITIEIKDEEEEELSMEIEGIKYPNGKKCHIRGSDILMELYNCARDLHVSYIELVDLSELKFDNCSLNLHVFYSLLHGHSWYNKFGYFPVVPKPINNLRSKSIEDYIQDTPDAKYDAKELLQILDISPASTILDMMAKLNEKTKRERGSDLCKLVVLYNKLGFKKYFDSMPYLRLRVNDENTKQIYNRLHSLREKTIL